MQIGIFGLKKFLRATFKIGVAVAQDEKAGDLLVRGVAGRATANAAGFGIKVKIGETETVLKAVGGHDGSDAVDVAEAKDQRDDGLRSDGIEAGGGRIVENHGRAIHQGTGDGDATAHAPGEVGRQHF